MRHTLACLAATALLLCACAQRDPLSSDDGSAAATPAARLAISGGAAGGYAGARALLAVQARQIRAMNAHDMDTWLSYCTDDYVMDYLPSPVLWDRVTMKAQFEAAYQSYPDFHVTPSRVFAAGNLVVDAKTMTGTQRGAWLGIPPTGRAVSVPILDVFEFRGDRVEKVTTYLDLASWMTQVGALPASPALSLAPSFTPPAAVPTGMTPTAAVQQMVDRFNSHDLADWIELFSADVVARYGSMGMVPLNRDQYVALHELNLLAFPDAHLSITRLVDLGDGWVLVEFGSSGTQTGPYFGIPASGNVVLNRWALLNHVDSTGLITETDVYLNNYAVLAQIGAVPAP